MKRVLSVFLIVVLLTGCSGAEFSESSIYSMDTYMTVRVYGSDAAAQVDQVVSQIQTYNSQLSATDPQSPLSALNRDGSAQLPPDVLDLLQRTVSLSERTGGALEPTVYPLVCLWGFPQKQYRVPDPTEITDALSKVGTAHIHIDEATVTLDSGSQLDFGAVAKGYTGQRCAQLLQENGVSAALLSLGGNVQTVGTKPDGSAWVVGITDPNQPDTYFATLTFTGTRSVVTSGGYQRYFAQNGKRYHHILDPATGYPAESGLQSVTVVTEDGLLADGLSTALFVMGLDKAIAFYRESNDFEAVFLTNDGSIYLTEGLTEAFSGAEYEVISK